MTEYFQIHRGSVPQWECDHMGHWNVQFYMARLSEGLAHFYHQFGLTPERIRGEQVKPAVFEILVRYQRELQAGIVFVIEAGIMAVGESSIELDVNVINLVSGQTAANMEVTLCYQDIASGEVLPWPDEVQKAFAGAVTERKFQIRPSSTLIPPNANGVDFVEPFISCRTSVNTWECDEFGRMVDYQYFDRASHSVGQIRNRLGFLGGSIDGMRLGSAALEYRMAFLNPLHAGDVMTMRSGVSGVSGKTFRFGHIMSNDASGEICALFDVVGVFFDLDQRKSVVPPATVQANFAANMMAWTPACHPLLQN